MLGEHPSERRLAGAAQADQRNAPRPVASAGSSPSGTCANKSKMAPSAAVRAPASGSSAAQGRSSACAIPRSTLTDGLPTPLSICAR
jgi:hypothetical protein